MLYACSSVCVSLWLPLSHVTISSRGIVNSAARLSFVIYPSLSKTTCHSCSTPTSLHPCSPSFVPFCLSQLTSRKLRDPFVSSTCHGQPTATATATMKAVSSNENLCTISLLHLGHSMHDIASQTSHGISTVSRTCARRCPDIPKSTAGRPSSRPTTFTMQAVNQFSRSEEGSSGNQGTHRRH